jgi:hypothetical protein
MRQPPPLTEPPSQRTAYLVRGVLMLPMAVFAEVIANPIVPWSFVPGQLALIVGAGIGLGVFERYYPKIASVAFVALAALVFWFSFASQTSMLPLFMLSAAYDLTRFGVRVSIELE